MMFDMLLINIYWMLSTFCTSSVSSFLTSGPNVWFPIIFAAVSAVIVIAAMIYMLSPLLGRNDMKVWARAKIYDGFITIIFAMIFLSFSTAICTINPVPIFNSLGMLPNSCNPAVSGNNPSSANIGDIYGLSLCELYQFNSGAASFTESIYWISLIGGINPMITVMPSAPEFPINIATGSGLGVSFSIQLFPIVLVHQYIIPYIQAYFAGIMASQLLQILLSSSMLLFSIFLILGLLARSFGITKSFGGAMIAFALGLGFVYPLMVATTYGFLDTAIQNAAAAGGAGAPALANLAPAIVTGLLSVPINMISRGVFSFASVLTPVIVYGGFIAAGLILIPLLNLIVVDAFIVDFSKAIGERMDLFSILTRII